jgi:hypothetical protein
MSTERDTHFQGFARLLWTAIVQSPEWPYISLSEEEIQQAETVIAQRAYDFAKHVLHSFEPFDFDTETRDDLLDRVPDLTEWPKTD